MQANRRKSMRPISMIAFACLLLSGCTHIQLQHSTLKQETTLTDLQYRQVLNNLAMLIQNRGANPYFALSSGGTVQVSDTGSGMLGLTWDPFGFTGTSLGLGGSRNLTEAWSLAPVLNPDKINRMRCAYQLLICGTADSECVDCIAALKDVLGKDFETKPHCFVPAGWFCVGKCNEVPKNACYVGHYGKTYVWVTPEKLDGLSRFTLTILDLATADPPNPQTVSVLRKYDGVPTKDNPYGTLKSTDVTNVEAPLGDHPARATFGTPIRVIPRLNPAIQLTPVQPR
jgi:hypothetical protein